MTLIIDESRDSRNYTPAAQVLAVFGYPRTVESLTIHHWGSYGQVYEIVRDYLIANGTPTSAHFVVERGRAACLVSPADASWAAGNAKGNASSIHIECRPEATAADYQAVVELIAYLRSIYGNVPLRPHSYWASTACPGVWNLPELDRRVRVLSKPAVKPAAGAITPLPTPDRKPTSKPKPTSKRRTYGKDDIHWVVEKGDTLSKIARYYGIPSKVAAIAEHNGIKPNALVIGERIWIPGPLVWIIEAPDTIRSVAKYYGLDAAHLARMNGLSGPDATIYIGNTLVIKA